MSPTGINPQALVNFIESTGLLAVRGPYQPSWQSTREANLIVTLLLLRNGYPDGFLTIQHMYDFGYTLQSVAQVVAAQCGFREEYVVGLAHGWDERRPSHRDSLAAFLRDRAEFLRGAEDGRKAGELAGLRFKYPGHVNPADFSPAGPMPMPEERTNPDLAEWCRHLDRQFGYRPKSEGPPVPPTGTEKSPEKAAPIARPVKARQARRGNDEKAAERARLRKEAAERRKAREQEASAKREEDEARRREERAYREKLAAMTVEDVEIEEQGRRAARFGGGADLWLGLVRAGNVETLAARAGEVLGVMLEAPAFLTACRNWLGRNGDVGQDWSAGTWAMWLKQRAVETGAYRGDFNPERDVRFFTLLHVGFTNIVEDDTHLANLRREEDRSDGPNYARSRIGHTTGWVVPVDRTAARVAPVEAREESGDAGEHS